MGFLLGGREVSTFDMDITVYNLGKSEAGEDVYITKYILDKNWMFLPPAAVNEPGKCIGIRTGRESGITVIRIPIKSYIPGVNPGKQHVVSYDGKYMYHIFDYDASRPTELLRADLRDLSVLNDGYFICIANDAEVIDDTIPAQE